MKPLQFAVFVIFTRLSVYCHSTNTSKSIRLIAQESDIDEAQLLLQNLSDSDFDKEIRHLYTFDQLSQTVSLVKNLSRVSCHHYSLGLSSIIDTIQERGYSQNRFPEVLSFPQEIPEECGNHTDTLNVNSYIHKLKAILLNSWTQDIIKGNFEDLLSYKEAEKTHFQNIIPNLVTSTAAVGKPLNIYRFIRKLQSPREEFSWYEKLYELFGSLENSEHLMELAYGLHRLSIKGKIDKTEEFRSQFTLMVNGLPEHVQNLFWNNGSCKIVNADTNETLTPSQTVNRNGVNVMYTSEAGANAELYPWKITPKHNQKGVIFKIQTVDELSELCFFKRNKKKRVILCQYDNSEDFEDQTLWKITPDLFSPGGFNLLYSNYVTNNYLATTDDWYGWKQRKVNVGAWYFNSVWQIECQR